MSLAEVALAAAALLDAADDRMLGVDAEGIAYDHAAAEAAVAVAGCLEYAAGGPDHAACALRVISAAAAALARLPVPTGRDVLRQELRAELERQGERLPPFLYAVA